ncbi:hypothetical protein HW115_16085 [Verrucomicrobiaceae bacterium N1E253]|uniref:Lipoprotein n=1 Tax=Oceaniferula marina TaxID=2748318 RepID=A0A851GJG3_9BACT|nr:hypothetical protein [Oceaniferula marina]NWK57142.1 hypothetical protein [Oceaniferula marina]
MKLLPFICLIPLAILLSSCSSTPQSRIQKNPELYNRLPEKHKALVQQGKIDRGMKQPAVYLAMGNPDSKVTGNREGRSYERWDYSVLTPVYTSGFGGYYGYGRGYYGRGPYYGTGYYPEVYYVPTRGSSVYFRKGSVVGWENKQR